MEKARKPATMRDVAARAGVSRSLVSTVFRGVPGASPDNRDRILQAAADLGYRPDERARRLRSRERRVVGVTLTVVHPFHVSLLEELHDSPDLRGYELSIGLSTDSRTLDRAVDTLLAQRCAGLVLIGPTAPDHELAALVTACGDVPVVVADRHAALAEADVLRVDDALGMSMAVDHLVALGHRDIWYLGGAEYVSAEPRQRGYERAMADRGMADRARVVEAGGTEGDGAAATMRLLEGSILPTAIVAYNDRIAAGAVDILWRRGFRVPDDMSVVGFDNVPAAALPHLALTTVEQRAEDLAAAVVAVLVARLSGEPPKGLQLMPPGRLVVRRSTMAPRPRESLRPVAG